MAETNASSASPNKTLAQPPPGGGGGGVGDATIAPPNPQHPSLPSVQLPPSPSMAGSDLTQIASPQLPQPQSQAALEYSSKQQAIQPQQQQQQQQQQQMQNQQQQQQKQTQQNLVSPSSNFQMQQNLQRSGSMPRLSQIQQQLGAAAAAGAMRQHVYGGQMNFGGAQIQQQQQHLAAAAAAAGIARPGMITQAGQLPMVAGQTAQHFNLQSQMLAQPRQKSLVQGAQFNVANSSGQTMQGMQNMGVMGTLGLNPQLRANGPMSYTQQRLVQGQMRQQQLSQQMALTSPQKLPGQSLPRTPSAAGLNSQVSGLTQNGQSTLVQNALSQQQQQQWLKHLQPSLSSPVSPSYHLQQQQRQQQSFLPQQLASSQLHSKSMALTQQQISQLMQQQPQLGNQQQQQQQQLLQQQQLQHLQLHQQQLQSPRLPGPAAQKSLSSQQETPASGGTAMPSGSSSQGTEPTNQLLGKRKINDLVLQVDPLGKLDPEVEHLLLEIADDFIDSVTSFACNLAKHRKSSTLEAKDVLLHLEKNWKLTIPGYTREEKNYTKKALPLDIHKKRLEMIGDFAETHQSEGDVGVSKVSNKQVLNNLGSDHSLRPSPSSEQLSLPVVGSQIMNKQQRF